MGMKSQFGQLKEVKKDHFRQNDVSDAFEIAGKISFQNNIADLLKQSTFKDIKRTNTDANLLKYIFLA